MNTSNAKTKMTNRATVTFHTSPEVKKRLDKLATLTNRSKSYLTNKAVELYLAEEEDFMTSVLEGMDDAKAGRVYTFDEVGQSLDTIMRKAAK